MRIETMNRSNNSIADAIEPDHIGKPIQTVFAYRTAIIGRN